MSEDTYFPRRFSFAGSDGQVITVDEAGLLAIPGPKVVLGEPGMGKSEFVKEIGRRLAQTPVGATRFMRSKQPCTLVNSGKPLLLDGLDEAIARREGDAVDEILAQLDLVGSPEVILCCRAREWQSRTVDNMRQLYGVEPTIFSIVPFTASEALAFLSQRFPSVNANHVIEHLQQHLLADLYTNPLTLALMGKVAQHDIRLPESRADLFQRVCQIIWPEHNPDRQDIGLGSLTEDDALDAAGAISAALLFAGAEALTLAGQAQVQDGDIRLVEIEVLPRARKARVVFSSKLFQTVGIARAKPIHRVIAEYLGARWLARIVASPRLQRRLLAQLEASGGVPASLRGLHAWIAYHSSEMAYRVIAADPFGVLRYGDTSTISAATAARLLDALQQLAREDPYFRVAAWDRQTTVGLFIPALREKIEGIITDSNSNEHLRSLMIEGLKGTQLANDLSAALENILFSNNALYDNRENAAAGLLANRDRDWWRRAITMLCSQGTEDSTRLARRLVEMIDCDVEDDLLVSTIFAELGLTICPVRRETKLERNSVKIYTVTLDGLPSTRLISVLNLIVEYSAMIEEANFNLWSSVARTVEQLAVRSVEEKEITLANAAFLWRCLQVLRNAQSPSYGIGKRLKALLDKDDALRQGVQRYALYQARPESTIFASEPELRRRLVGLTGKQADIIALIEFLYTKDNKDSSVRDDWFDLMALGQAENGFDPRLRSASAKFQRGDKALEALLYKLENPEKPAWLLEEERREIERNKLHAASVDEARRQFGVVRDSIRAGDLNAILSPAQVYLGCIYSANKDQPARDRISDWLGEDFLDDVFSGFEAVLRRKDLPNSRQISIGLADRKLWNYSYPIMAALLARHRGGRSLEDLDLDLLLTGLLLCYNQRGLTDDKDIESLLLSLEQIVIPTQEERRRVARLWIEPGLRAGNNEIYGLHRLIHDTGWAEVGPELAAEWLAAYTNLPESIELQLIDSLIRSTSTRLITDVAEAQDDVVFLNLERMFAWLAVDVLVRFEYAIPHLKGIGRCNPEFLWFLRNRFHLAHRGSMVLLGVAQARWVFSEFRQVWPYAVLIGTGVGDTNPYDATDFLRALLARLANDSSPEASEALSSLCADPEDSYSNLVRHMAAEQRQKRVEEDFRPISPRMLAELLIEGPPANVDDLKSIVLEELAVAQTKLIGDDTDQVCCFWSDIGIPYGENRCRDRLAAMLSPELARYGIQRIIEADMPMGKRADLAFAYGNFQLPMEVKGQWHPEVWSAASGQLDAQYLIDWRSSKRGIFCVFWFGELPASSGRRLKAAPDDLPNPTTAEEMQRMLTERIPLGRRTNIDVIVLDLTAGNQHRA